jgi:hypothetical protein
LCACVYRQHCTDHDHAALLFLLGLLCLSVVAGGLGRCFYRHLYLPDQAMFAALPEDLGFGAYAEPPQQAVQLAALPDGAGFIKDGVQYRCVCICAVLVVAAVMQFLNAGQQLQ